MLGPFLREVAPPRLWNTFKSASITLDIKGEVKVNHDIPVTSTIKLKKRKSSKLVNIDKVLNRRF